YALDDPTTLVDPSGLTACADTDCPPRVQAAANNLCGNTSKITNARVRRCVQAKCRQNLPIGCKHPDCDKDNEDAGEPWLYGVTPPPGNKIFVCPRHIPTTPTVGPPGCMERVIAHEMKHSCRRRGPAILNQTVHDNLTDLVANAVPCPF